MKGSDKVEEQWRKLSNRNCNRGGKRRNSGEWRKSGSTILATMMRKLRKSGGNSRWDWRKPGTTVMATTEDKFMGKWSNNNGNNGGHIEGEMEEKWKGKWKGKWQKCGGQIKGKWRKRGGKVKRGMEGEKEMAEKRRKRGRK